MNKTNRKPARRARPLSREVALLDFDALIEESCPEFERIRQGVALDRSGPDDSDAESITFTSLMFQPRGWR